MLKIYEVLIWFNQKYYVHCWLPQYEKDTRALERVQKMIFGKVSNIKGIKLQIGREAGIVVVNVVEAD